MSVKKPSKSPNRFDTEESKVNYKKVLEDLLSLLKQLRNAATLQEKLDLIARGIGASGWRRVHFYVFDSKTRNLKSATSYGLSEQEIEHLRTHGMDLQEIEGVLSPEYEDYKIGRSYYFPHDCDDPFVSDMRKTGIKSKYKPGQFKNWHPEDILYFPVIGFGGKIIGLISVDDPVDGKRPTEESLRSVELFIDYATTVLEESEFEDYFNKTRNILSRIFDLSPSMIFIIDEKKKIIDLNTSVSKNLGYKPFELIGKPESIVFSSDITYERMEKQRREGIFQGEVIVASKDGTERWGYLSSVPVFDPDGVIDGYITTIVDVTEMKQLQQYLIRAEKLAGIGVLASGIAHEVNNPLYAILGLAEMIAETDGLSPNVISMAREIIQYSRDASDIVKNLSGYTYSAQREATSSVNLNEVISNAVRMVERAASTEGIAFDIDLKEIPAINASTGEMTQVFVNLITNAVDALDDKGGVISLRTRLVGDNVECRVRDTGKGISEEDLDRIFEPFFTTKEVGKGTGLGLYVCYRIVTKHKGTINIESTSEKGTCFVVTLPIPKNDE
ncbi:hypothetical protein DRQ36_10610 [bacterium]|nr:MAG: hypothetical protein DRQ36_10610 [bacterium]